MDTAADHDQPRPVERIEIARALEIVGDDACHPLPEIPLPGEVRDRDRHRLELTARPDTEAQLRLRPEGEQGGWSSQGKGQNQAAQQAGDHGQGVSAA